MSWDLNIVLLSAQSTRTGTPLYRRTTDTAKFVASGSYNRFEWANAWCKQRTT